MSQTRKGQNVITSMFITLFILFIVLIPINMLISGTRTAYGDNMQNAQNFTFKSADDIVNVTTAMTDTVISSQPSDLGQVSLVTTVVNGAINSLQLLLIGVGSVFSVFGDFFQVEPLSYAAVWLQPMLVSLFGITITLAAIAAYLRWRP